MKLYKDLEKIAGIVIEILYFHTNMNGFVFLAYST